MLTAQTYVNKEWVQTSGTPDETIDWQASVLDVNGDILISTNTTTPGEASNILTTKVSAADGSILWEKEYNHPSNDKDYGTAIATDATGNVYVAGAANIPGAGYDFVLLKYAGDGTLQWSKTYDGISAQNDVPVAIAVDVAGNVYVTGGSQNGTALIDYCTIKYDANGSQLWLSHYDYNSLYDAPIALQIDPQGGIVVTGVSAENTTNWESATIKYDADDGTQIAENRIEQAAGIDEPADFTMDDSGNFYITGKTSIDGINYDIRTIKLTANLEIAWVQDYDAAGLEDAGASIDVDAQGNVFVGGYVHESGGTRKALVLRYDADGTQVSDEIINTNADTEMTIEHIKVEESTVLLTGKMETSGSSKMFARAQDTDSQLLWQKQESGSSESTGKTILIADNSVSTGTDAAVFITGTSEGSASITTTTTKYSKFKRPTEVVADDEGRPVHMDRMLIARFQRDAVLTDAIDNTDIVFGRAGTFLTPDAIADLNANLSFDINTAHFVKMYKRLKTTHTTSISRLGETIRIPDFWTSFVVVLPELTFLNPSNSSTETLLQTCRDMEEINHVVRYAHLNYLATAQSNSCGAGNNTPNDPEYGNQHSLYSTDYPNAHVNAEEAWEIETGESYIKVGVLDGSLDWEHPDFEDSQGGNSSIIAGWDFETDTDLFGTTIDWSWDGGHASACAGIIGALRDNNLGVAGIAGGCDTDRGVSLYSLRVFGGTWFDPDGDGLFPMDYVGEAIVTASTENNTLPNAYGLHVMNMSINIRRVYDVIDQIYPDSYSDASIQALSDAIHYANRNKVVFTASGGNIEDPSGYPEYPADYDDNWVMCVGGTNDAGNWIGTLRESPVMDIAAPAQVELVRTTWLTSTGEYSQFGGTSSAAPHVAGAAGLMLSYMNVATPNYGNLAPEDVEYVLQATAKPMEDGTPPSDLLTGYTNTGTGYGLLQIHDAIDYIRRPDRTIKHFGTACGTCTVNSIQLSPTPIAADVKMRFTEPYEDLDGINSFTAFNLYYIDVYTVTADISHPLMANETIEAFWGRHSSSTTLKSNYYDSYELLDFLVPHEEVELISVTPNNTIIQGYVYQVKEYMSPGVPGPVIGWIPLDPTSPTGLEQIDLEYSLLVSGGTYAVNDHIYFVDEVHIYPNPASVEHTIQISANAQKNLKIDLYNTQGIHIQSIYDEFVYNGDNQINVDLKHLPAGVYFYTLNSTNGTYAEKFVKL